MDAAEARRRFGTARVARLATVGPDSRPHLVPVCFALAGDTLWTAIDDVKPKAGVRLRRLANVAANPAVALLADHYDDRDWGALWWVRADGRARVVDGPAPRARALLAERYPQYAAAAPGGPVLAVQVERWSGWAATPGTLPP